MIDTTINLLVNRMECTNLSGTTLTLRLAVKSDNSSPAILFRDSEKLDATIKLSLTLPTHSCRCPHGRMKSGFTHNYFSKFHKLRSLLWFCHKITNHLISWTILHIQISLIHLIRNEKYRTFNARDCLPMLFLPFFSNKIALLLS